INPSAATFGGATPPTEMTNILAVDPDLNGIISSLVLLNRTTPAPNSMTVDDVRIGRTWRFVTGGPEFSVCLATNTSSLYSLPLTAPISLLWLDSTVRLTLARWAPRPSRTNGSGMGRTWLKGGTFQAQPPPA